MKRWIVGLFLALMGEVIATNYAYVANEVDNSVSVIDVSTDVVTATISVGNTPVPIAITPDGKYVYVGNQADSSVSVISVATREVITTIEGMPVGDEPGGIAITPSGEYAYVAGGNNVVSVINTSNNEIYTNITVAGSSELKAVAITPNGAYAYVGDQGVYKVFVIEIATNTVSATIDFPDSYLPETIAITPDGAYAYVTLAGTGNEVAVIETANNTVVADISVGMGPVGIAITPDGSYAYVANINSNDIFVIQVSDNTVVATIPLSDFPSPRAVAITSDGAYAYVGLAEAAGVAVIETANNTVIATVSVGSLPGGIVTTPRLLAPSSISGLQTKSNFGLMYELYNTIEWSASPSLGVSGYYVYRNGMQIASTSTFSYVDHNQPRDIAISYSVAAFDGDGYPGFSANVTVD